MYGPVPVFPGKVGLPPHMTVGAPGRNIRTARLPVSPPGGAVPKVPSRVHPTPAGCLGSDTLPGFRNGTSERLVVCAFETARDGFIAPVEGGAGCHWRASAKGIAQTAKSRSR